MRILSLLLLPFSPIFGWIASCRYFLYKVGIFKRHKFSIPTIVVGNLKVGGTGKTPHTRYVLEHLIQPGAVWALLSRGYGRSTKGFVYIDASATAATVGDEPYMLYHKLAPGGMVAAVCESRPQGIQKLLHTYPHLTGVVLDDAFQHFALQADCYILLTEYSDLFVHDRPLPGGRLRELSSAAARAHCIVVTKCPLQLSHQSMRATEQKIAYYAPNVPICFTGYTYQAPYGLNTSMHLAASAPVIAFSGIAGNEDFKRDAGSAYQLKACHAFADHHAYTAGEVKKLAEEASAANAALLTTEKDAVKLKPYLDTLTPYVPVYARPIGVKFLMGEDLFWQSIQKHTGVAEAC